MTPDEMTHTLRLLKQAGMARKAKDFATTVWRASKKGAGKAAEELEGKGHGLAGSLVRIAPEATVGAGLYAGWKSDPVQRMRYKYRLWKHRRAQRRAQRGY
jgi:hypothetical protein